MKFNQLFRQGKIEAFEAIMALAISHAYGCYNPKQWADYLGINHQKIYAEISTWTVYRLKKVLQLMMINQAVEEMQKIKHKSAATQSRAKVTIAVDDSVIDRVGKRLRCTWNWYSGRWKKVVNGQNILGIVLTINGKAFPIGLRFCAKQGRTNTDKPTLLVAMLKEIKEEFDPLGIDITNIPLTMDSWYVSELLKQKLHQLGFKKIVVAGKSSYVFSDQNFKSSASDWKKEVNYDDNLWGIDAPAQRKKLLSPTFGLVNLLFFRKSSTRCFLLMDLSVNSLRGVEIWRIWQAHNVIEQFWKILKSVLKIGEMKLRKQGIYTGLLIKTIAYLLMIKVQLLPHFRHLSLNQIMRKIKFECDLQNLLCEHFHLDFLGIVATP